MCDNRNCECHNFHQDCIIVITLQNVTTKLNKKGKLSEPILISLCDWIDAQIKVLTRKKEEIKIQIGDGHLILINEEAKLHQYMF